MSEETRWIELPTADTAKARAFYGSLFGWGTSEFGGDYQVIDNGPAGAIAPREDDFTPRTSKPSLASVDRALHDDQGPFRLYEPAAHD